MTSEAGVAFGSTSKLAVNGFLIAFASAAQVKTGFFVPVLVDFIGSFQVGGL